MTTIPAPAAPDEDWLARPARMLCFTIYALIFSVIYFRIYNTFVFNELYYFTFENALASGYGLQWIDFKKALDWAAYDGVPRARILSALAGIIDTKLKIWMVGQGLLLPTVSITTPLVLFVAPWFLWHVIRAKLTPGAAWAGVCAYLTATSVLSCAGMVMHAGKPLNLFFGSWLLWLFHRIELADMLKRPWWRKSLILFGIFMMPILAFASDESAIALIGVAPVLFWQFIWKRPLGRAALAAILLAVPAAWLWITYGLPALMEAAGYGSGSIAGGYPIADIFSHLNNLPMLGRRIGWTLFAGLAQPIAFFDVMAWHLLPDGVPVYPVYPFQYPDTHLGELLFNPRLIDRGLVVGWAIITCGLFLAFALYAVTRSRRHGLVAAAAFVAMLGIATMQGFILMRNSFGYGMYYQGGLMALPYAVLIAALISAPAARAGERGARILLLMAMMGGALWNYFAEFRYWRAWDTQMSGQWYNRMLQFAESRDHFEAVRHKLIAWAGPQGFSGQDIEVFNSVRNEIEDADYDINRRLMHKLSLNVVMKWRPDMQPACDICALVSKDAIVAVRLKGRAKDLPLPDFLQGVKIIRG